MKYNFKNETLDGFTALLSGKSSVPGGGGAAALIASVGISLSSMAAAFTVGKPAYAEVNDDMERLLLECEELRKEALSLMDRDAEVFEPMSAVYKMPKDTEEEREEKARAMEACLRDAASVPLSLMELCCRGIDIAGEAAKKGSRLLISDAGCSAASLDAALSSAYLNVLINTSSMKDRAYAAELEEKAKKMYLEADGKARKVYSAVLESIQG